MRLRALIIGSALGALLSAGALAQQDGTIQRWDFENGTDGWQALDAQATWGRTNAADVRFKGDWSGELAYTQRLPAQGNKDDHPGTVIASLPEGVPGLQSVHFAVASAFGTPIIVALCEEDGSSYQACVWSESGRWNECSLSLDDFILGRDSTDENGALDLDQVNVLGFVDGGQFGRALAAGGLPIFNPKPEKNTIWLDEVVLSADPVEDRAQDGAVIDSCDSDTIQWLPLGAESVYIDPVAATGEAPAHYKFDYVAPARSIFGVMRQMPVGTLAGCTAIRLQLRCDLDASLIMVLEDVDQNRYVAGVQVPSGPDWQTREIKFSSMQGEGGNRSNVPRFRASKIVRVFMADLRGIQDGTFSANVWRLRDIRGTK